MKCLHGLRKERSENFCKQKKGEQVNFEWKYEDKYAISELWRNYVPLWILFRKWGMKGVYLRKLHPLYRLPTGY